MGGFEHRHRVRQVGARRTADAADFRNLNVGTDIAVINSRLEEMETLLLQLATENKQLKAAADPTTA